MSSDSPPPSGRGSRHARCRRARRTAAWGRAGWARSGWRSSCARLHRRAGEERLDRRGGAAAEVAADHRVPGVRDDLSSWASGISAATCRASVGRRAQVLPAGEDQRRHVGQRARRAAAAGTRRARTRTAGIEACRSSAAVGVEGVEVAQPGSACRAASASTARVVGGALRCHGNGSPRRWCRRTAFRRSSPSPARSLGTFGISPLGSSVQAQQRVGVAVQRGVHRGRQSARAARGSGRPPRGCRAVSALVERGRRDAAPVPSYTEPLSRCACAAARSGARGRRAGCGDHPSQAPPRAQFVEHAGRSPGRWGVRTVRGPVGGTTESSTSASTFWG